MHNKQRAKRYLFGTMLGFSAGIILYFIQPLTYKSELTVKIGHSGKNQKTGENDLIEPNLIVIQRIKSNDFQRNVLSRLESSREFNLLGEHKRFNLSAKPIRNTNYINVFIQGDSERFVYALTKAFSEELLFVHSNILKENRLNVIDELQELESNPLLSMQDSNKLLDYKSLNFDRNVDQEVLLMYKLVKLQFLLDCKLKCVSGLKKSISSSKFYNSSIVFPPSVKVDRLFTHWTLLGLLGAILGFMLSMICKEKLIIWFVKLRKEKKLKL